MPKRETFDDLAQSIADRMTTEQYLRLLDIIDPLTPEQRQWLDSLTDEDLLRELSVPTDKEGNPLI